MENHAASPRAQAICRFSACVISFAGLSGTLNAATANEAHPVLVEAEGFADTGGWVVDPQFMDQMGSPYLLAHGLGVPVADAVTQVTFPQAGRFRVWVRTKDWVARWKAPGTPGRFQVLINGKPLAATFGTVGAEWHRQDGGEIDLTDKPLCLSLHDLTGFDGRCDAILFSSDLAFEPPNADPEMAVFRRRCFRHPGQPETAGDYDLVVTGGGITGTCAAVTAARLGLKVALIQDRPVLGGNNSSEVRVWLQGARSKEPWPRVGDVVAELESERRAHYGPSNTADLYQDDKKLAVVRGEPNIDLFLEHRSNGIEMDGRRIRAVLAQEIRTGRRLRFTGRWFADCTGDACIGALAGADFDMRLENKMGPCNLRNVCECKDTNARNIENLFMAGRCISVTHEALGAVRVMRTCGTGGEIVGMAASVCKDFGIDPALFTKSTSPPCKSGCARVTARSMDPRFPIRTKAKGKAAWERTPCPNRSGWNVPGKTSLARPR